MFDIFLSASMFRSFKISEGNVVDMSGASYNLKQVVHRAIPVFSGIFQNWICSGGRGFLRDS